MKKRIGFTLAEVLITLAIIGIVAALTIPAVIRNYQETQYRVAYKKAYSDAARVWNLMGANSEIQVKKGLWEGGMATNNFPVFKSYFNVVKECRNTRDCFTNADNAEMFSEYNDMPATPLSFIDSQGRSWGYTPDSYFEIAYILVDTNGNKKPNVLGKDRFPFATLPVGCSHSTADLNSPRCYTNVVPVRLVPLADTNYVRWCKSMKTCLYTAWLRK